MKRILFTGFALLIVLGITAQEPFKVHKPFIEQKLGNMIGQWEYMAIVSISYAKAEGKTANEFGHYVGEQFKTSWDKEKGFKGLVNGMLWNLSCFSLEPEMEIVSQTADKVEMKCKKFAPYLEKNQPVFDVSYQEFMDFMDALMAPIAEYLGCSHELRTDEKWVYIIVQKN
ncbi:hypothetical protein KEM09_03690 [Carboxylicivirga mesophila]|uniref:DUF1579 domain-containing protein n=1 Tax=Carboxylicivirga mesophila TaxID=1166478 RepID=A0ABS5K6A5_9BACT|nr:hypothetical protein [Carboxylicivirga mesophila]MBS2210486.1 hypothetical protein [Carboxylicivirga mesophila]